MAKAASKKSGKTAAAPLLSPEKKKKLTGILLLLASLLAVLSIVSYSRFDRELLTRSVSEVLSVANPNGTGHAARNLLGIAGVYLSEFFINTTIGYFSLVFPVIFGMVGYSLLRPLRLKTLIYGSAFLLIGGLLMATFAGVLRTDLGVWYDAYELSGSIGEYAGSALASMLGSVGSIVLLLAAFIVLLVLAFDISLGKMLASIKDTTAASAEGIKEKISIIREKLDEEEEETPAQPTVKGKTAPKNGGKTEKPATADKIVPEQKDKKKKTAETPVPADATAAANTAEDPKEEAAKTTIKIQRKNEERSNAPQVSLVNSVAENLAAEEPAAEEGDADMPDREGEATLPDPWNEKITFKTPGIDLLQPIPKEDVKIADDELKRNAELLKEKLALFDIQIEKIEVTPGPVVTLFEIVPAPGVKISKIVSLEHDIALALAARGIRIIAPIPGKSAIGVEIPNSEPSLVVARQVLLEIAKSKAELPLGIGKTIAGEATIADLAKMPHLLVAGSTGSGKSVGINMMIASLIYAKHPSEVKFAIIDPKKIELSFYKRLRYHYLAVCPDLDEDIVTVPQNAVILLKSVEYEMERRYDMLAKAGVRNITDYNKKVADTARPLKDTETIKHHYLPYIVVIIDELADLMITAGKEVEEPIARLAQLARAVGIHLVLATQRPSVNVITGVIKANFSARMAYQVATKIDSRTILDMNGAEQLLGRGDMLYLPGGSPKPVRVQNAFITTEEVERITDFIYAQQGYSKPYYLPSIYDKKKDGKKGFIEDLDPMFEEAARVIVRTQQGSVSLLQRRLKLGYSRAARIVDQLEQAGIVGPNDGSKAREVIVENEEQLETIIRNL